jgi:hypothetical protein
VPYLSYVSASFVRFVVVAVAVTALASGCSALIDAGRDQCSSDGDCERLGLNGTCDRGVCSASRVAASSKAGNKDVAGGPCDGGACAPGDASMEPADASADAAQPAAPGPLVCTADVDCEDDERCFKKRCALSRLTEPFVCEPKTGDVSQLVHFQMPAREFVSTQAPKGLRAQACMRNDIACNDPVATYTDMTGEGVIEMDLPYEFDGFLDVRSDDTLPALWYFTDPLIAPRVAKDLGVVAPATLELLAAITGYDADASKGLIVLEAFDCNHVAVGGIHFEEDKKVALPFYIVDSTPNVLSTVTVRDEKEDIAPGGFFNAQPGFTVFSARLGLDGPVISEFNAHVRANTVTYLDLYP